MLDDFKIKPLKVCSANMNPDVKKVLQAHYDAIKNSCFEIRAKSANTACFIGKHLKELLDDKSYGRALRTEYDSFNCFDDPFLSEPCIRFCEYYFGFSKTKFYAYLRIYELFGQSDGTISEPYSAYTYSQLVEMSSMNGFERDLCKPEMTISEMRELKKKSRGAEEKKEDKPSAPDDSEPSSIAQRYVFKNMTVQKEVFKTRVRGLFEKSGFKVMDGDKVIGGQAFGALLFDYLKQRGFFDAGKSDKQNGASLLRAISK